MHENGYVNVLCMVGFCMTMNDDEWRFGIKVKRQWWNWCVELKWTKIHYVRLKRSTWCRFLHPQINLSHLGCVFAYSLCQSRDITIECNLILGIVTQWLAIWLDTMKINIFFHSFYSSSFFLLLFDVQCVTYSPNRYWFRWIKDASILCAWSFYSQPHILAFPMRIIHYVVSRTSGRRRWRLRSLLTNSNSTRCEHIHSSKWIIRIAWFARYHFHSLSTLLFQPHLRFLVAFFCFFVLFLSGVLANV